jgi:hypothetical protein
MQMPSDSNRAPVAPKISHSEKVDRHEAESEDVDLGVDIDTSGVLEGVDGAEDGAEAMGNVSEAKENLGEHRQATGGKFQQFQQQMTDEEAEELKKKLLQSPPTSRMMVKEVRKKIHHEILELQKTAREAKSNGAYRDLTASVAKIRELRGILGKMFHATAEAIKNVWLKVVYGIV